MIALTAALVVALSLGAGDGRAHKPTPGARAVPGATLSNAARARAGLLPRKVPRKVTAAKRKGIRVITTASHSPTFLGEPIPLAEAPRDEREVGAVAESAPVLVATEEVRDLRLAASSVVTDVVLVLRYPP